MITCPSCSSQNEVGAAFCDNCGSDLRNVAPTLTPTATPQAAGDVACPNCGYSNMADASFCENCGSPLSRVAPAGAQPPPVQIPQAAGGVSCPGCGHNNVSGALFCENCGSPLSQVAPAVPPPTPAPVPQAASGTACPGCGYENVPGAVFCENCGSQLGQQMPSQQPPVQQLPVQQPVQPPIQQGLVGRLVIQGSNTNINIPPGKSEIFVGRSDPVSGVFPEIDLDPHGGHDSGVGRKHARLFLQGGRLMLEDLNSVNGTMLNKQKVLPGQPQPVSNGDELRFGKIAVNYYQN